MPVTLVCDYCGKTFHRSPSAVSPNDNYCGMKCYHAARQRDNKPGRPRERVARTCEQCGAHFEIIPSWLKGGGGRFCSRQCSHEHKRTVTGENHPLYTKVELTCQWCGKKYTQKKSIAERGSKFCSPNCHGAYRSHTIGRKPTSIERKVKAMLDDIGIEYIAEKPMGAFVCDFVIKPVRLVIECDGSYWHNLPEVKARDANKDKWLKAHGYFVLRLSEDDINSNPRECKQRIVDAISRRRSALR